MADTDDLYAVLGVHPTSSAEAVKEAYRRLAKEKHPDVCKTPTAEKDFAKLQHAYDVLSDPAQRSEYDQVAMERAVKNAAPDLMDHMRSMFGDLLDEAMERHESKKKKRKHRHGEEDELRDAPRRRPSRSSHAHRGVPEEDIIPPGFEPDDLGGLL